MALCLVLAVLHHGDKDVAPPSKLSPLFLLPFPPFFYCLFLLSFPTCLRLPFPLPFTFFFCSRSNPYVYISCSYPSLEVMSRVNQELVGHHHHHHPDVAAAVDKLAVAVGSLQRPKRSRRRRPRRPTVWRRASSLRRRRWPG